MYVQEGSKGERWRGTKGEKETEGGRGRGNSEHISFPLSLFFCLSLCRSLFVSLPSSLPPSLSHSLSLSLRMSMGEGERQRVEGRKKPNQTREKDREGEQSHERGRVGRGREDGKGNEESTRERAEIPTNHCEKPKQKEGVGVYVRKGKQTVQD